MFGVTAKWKLRIYYVVKSESESEANKKERKKDEMVYR